MKSFNLFPLLCLAARVSAADVEITGTPDQLAVYVGAMNRTASLTGVGKVEADVQSAVVHLVVTTEDKSLANGLKLNQTVRDDLRQTLVNAGIGEDRIRSASFSSTPEHGWISGKVRSYRVENQVRITVESEAELQAVAKVIDGKEELRYNTLQRDTAQEQAQALEALQKACADVTLQKQLLEENLGVRLVPRRINDRRTAESPQLGLHGKTPPRGGYVGSTPLPALEPTPSADFGRTVYRSTVTVEFDVQLKN